MPTVDQVVIRAAKDQGFADGIAHSAWLCHQQRQHVAHLMLRLCAMELRYHGRSEYMALMAKGCPPPPLVPRRVRWWAGRAWARVVGGAAGLAYGLRRCLPW